jgi:uncharacterized protein YndB with AHSA1/START domain
VERILLVPPERVFAAFVDAEQLRRWWGPVGFRVVDLELHAAEGTDYRIAMQPPEGSVFHVRGTFRSVEPPRRLAFTFLYEEPDPDDQETLVKLTFQPVPQDTRVVLDQGPFKTPARWALHRDGWTQTLGRLGQSLT